MLIQRLILFGRSLRPQYIQDFLVMGLWLAALIWLEVVGRRTLSDVADAFLLCGVASLIGMTTVIHLRWKLQSATAIGRLTRLLTTWITGASLKYGADLRGTPAIPRRWPLRWWWIPMAVATTVIWLALNARFFPNGFREFLASKCYVAYLLLLATLWTALLGGAIIHSLFAWGSLHDVFVESFQGRGRRPLRAENLTVSGVIYLLLACGLLLPVGVTIGIYLLLFCVYSVACLLLPPGLVILWRPNGEGLVRGIDGRGWYWVQGTVPILVSAALVLASRGEACGGRPLSSAMPLTSGLGQFFAWTAVAGTTALTWQCLRLTALGIFFHPRQSARTDVASQTPEERIRALRREEIVHRRRIVRGLEKLFKRARRHSYSQGTGFLIGLQHWFILGMVRDEDEQNHREDTFWDGIIGPPFYRAFSPAARQHFREMTTALQVDLLFVEDGIPFRRFVRVLKMMFEIYDIFGGRRRIEEWHFTGLPGIRVVIHDFSLENPLVPRGEGYPEPNYDEIGRARIVHVFKDRGESEERVPVPSNSEGEPVLTGV